MLLRISGAEKLSELQFVIPERKFRRTNTELNLVDWLINVDVEVLIKIGVMKPKVTLV